MHGFQKGNRPADIGFFIFTRVKQRVRYDDLGCQMINDVNVFQKTPERFLTVEVIPDKLNLRKEALRFTSGTIIQTDDLMAFFNQPVGQGSP